MLSLKKLAHAVYDPIIEEFPLFAITFLLAILDVLRVIHGGIINHYSIAVWGLTFRYLGFPVLFSFAYAQLACHFRYKIVRILCYGCPIILFTVNIFSRINFGGPLTPQYVMAIGETNSQETSEFLMTFLLCTHGLIVVLIVFAAIAGCYLAEKYKRQIGRMAKRKYSRFAICAVSTILFVFGCAKIPSFYSMYHIDTMKQMDGWGYKYLQGMAMSQDIYSNFMYSTYMPTVAGKQMRESINISLSDNSCKIEPNDSLNIVLVIGESFIKWHSSLYGYYLDTTPIMKEEYQKGNLFVFKHINTPYNQTSTTLRNFFSCNCMGLGEDWGANVFMPILFKRSGYDVYFWDNQNVQQANTWDFTLNSYLHNDKLASASYTVENTRPYQYDGDLIDDFLKRHFSLNKNTLTIIHLWGQHLKAELRYPHTAKLNRFTADSVKVKRPWLTKEMRKEIAQYDNATYYNDVCMGKIFDHYRNANTVIVYLSDHGEEIYDWRPSMGRQLDPMCRNVVKYQFEIPFMVWCSEKYKANYPDRVRAIRAALNKPMPSDITCNMLFHLAGLKTKHYRPQLDVLNEAYKCPRRTINDKWDFTKYDPATRSTNVKNSHERKDFQDRHH